MHLPSCKTAQWVPMSSKVKSQYEEELQRWIKNGWLILYDEHPRDIHRESVQKDYFCKWPWYSRISQVYPIMNYRELNQHVNAFTVDADICASKMSECYHQGSNISLLDLKATNLLVHIHKSLWPYQTIMFHRRGTAWPD